jgi:TRAP-type C4-dicarboxylate transport system permease small subunit
MILNIIGKIFKYIIAILTIALTIAVSVSVIFRYILHNTLFWGTEISVIFFIWIVFLGAAVGYHENSHINFGVLVDLMNPAGKKAVNFISYITLLFFLGYIVFFNFDVVTKNLTSYTEALKLPYGLVYSCVPLSCFYMLIDTIDKIGKLAKGGNDCK